VYNQYLLALVHARLGEMAKAQEALRLARGAPASLDWGEAEQFEKEAKALGIDK